MIESRAYSECGDDLVCLPHYHRGIKRQKTSEIPESLETDFVAFHIVGPSRSICHPERWRKRRTRMGVKGRGWEVPVCNSAQTSTNERLPLPRPGERCVRFAHFWSSRRAADNELDDSCSYRMRDLLVRKLWKGVTRVKH